MKSTIKIILATIYAFVVIGLWFHTSSHAELFQKYTYRYFFLLLIITLFFVPFLRIINYLTETSKVKIKNKKYTLTPIKKFLILIIFLILFIWLPGEILLRASDINFKANPNVLTINNFHPFLQHKLDISNNESEKDIHVNKYGFRSNEFNKQKQHDEYRIFVIGGSTVLNRNVPYEKSFEAILYEKLNIEYKYRKIEVINAGNDEYTSQHSIIDLMFKIQDFQPDMIIFLHGINDMTASCTPEGYSLGEYMPDYSHYLGSIGPMVLTYFIEEPIIKINSLFLIATDRFIKHNLYSDVFAYIKTGTREVLSTTPSDVYAFPSIISFKRNINYVIQFTKENNIELVLVNQPYQYNMKAKDTIWYAQRACNSNSKHPSTKALINGIETFNNATKKIAEENEVLFVDLASQLPKTPEYFVDDVHFTEKANKRIAEVFFNYLVNNALEKE